MFSPNTGFYFYSSLLQAQAAIFSIVGVFIVFKLQTIKSAIENYKHMLLALKVYPSVITDFEFADEATRKEKYIRLGKGSEQITYLQWNESETKVKNIKDQIKTPIILLSIGMIVSTLGLIFTCFINNVFILEIILLATVTTFFLYTLFIVYNSIDRILG